MVFNVMDFLSDKGIEVDDKSVIKHYGMEDGRENVSIVKHAGVKGMKWGIRRSDTDGDGKVDGESGGGGGDEEELVEELDGAEKALMDKLKKDGWKRGSDESGLYMSAKHMSGDPIINEMGKQLGRGFTIQPGSHKIYLKRSKESKDWQLTPKKAFQNFVEDLTGK